MSLKDENPSTRLKYSDTSYSVYRHFTVGLIEMPFTCPKMFTKIIKDALSKKPGNKAFGSKKAILQKEELCLNRVRRSINVHVLNINTKLAQRD